MSWADIFVANSLVFAYKAMYVKHLEGVMARSRSFEVSGLNIRVHTKHSCEEYVEFWRMLYVNRATVLHGSSAMMIGEARKENSEDPESPISGYIYKFLNIDPSEPWFDIQRKKPATDEDVSKVSIPDFLKPNLRLVPYVFLPSKHQLFFVSKASSDSMAAGTVNRLITKLSENTTIVERFGVVDISTITDQKEIESFFHWHSIKTLDILIKRPNPLEDEDEEDVLDRLERLNAGSERIVLKKAPEAATLTPDDTVKNLAYIAADNGEVRIDGRNEQGVKDHASSKDFPMHERVTYQPNLQSNLQALISFVTQRFM
ncbi:DUF4747 family protein [Kerstersia gyiorum]|uniref:DUF4747 family protein n=1 Tax=Kerstersia gyiorum TaxID=206506 RepID=UPI000A045326|nr:DUF4747 family protein [Kerstersia gyiorum]